MAKKKIRILIALFVGLFIYIPGVLAFSGEDQKVINELNKNFNSFVEENKELKSNIELIKSSQTDINLATQKLIEGVNVKNEGVDFKSHYYDLALELLTLFGIIVVVVAIAVGIIKGKEMVKVREEMREALNEIKKKSEDINELNNKRVDFEIEKMKEADNQKMIAIENRSKNFVLSIRDALAEKTIEINEASDIMKPEDGAEDNIEDDKINF